MVFFLRDESAALPFARLDSDVIDSVSFLRTINESRENELKLDLKNVVFGAFCPFKLN